MKGTVREGQIILAKDKTFLGICLGWDYTAEHEWGIKKMTQGFKCNLKKFGFDSTKIHDYNDLRVYRNNDAVIFTNVTERDLSPADISREAHLQKDDTGIEFYACWDETYFAVAFVTIPEAAAHYIEELEKAITKKDLCLAFKSSKNPFARSGLCFNVYSHISKKIKKDCAEADRDERDVNDDFAKHPTILRLNAKRSEWRTNHSGHRTPWDAICLKPESRKGKKDFVMWLNPGHQQHLFWGRVTMKDVENWIDGKVGTIIKSKELWDELLFICSGAHMMSMVYDLPYFTKEKAKFYSLYRYEVKRALPIIPTLKKKEIGTMPYEVVKIVAQLVKNMYIQDINDQVIYGKGGTKINGILDVHSPTQEVQNELYGFFHCLSLMGYGTIEGACNTPKSYDNFAWWKGVLFSESLWDVLIEKGMAYEPWVKNGHSLTYKKESE